MSDVMFPKRPGRKKRQNSTIAPNQTMRVALYTRISTDERNQPHSLEAQRKMLESYAASQPGWVITHRYADQKSGATDDRPELQNALAAAERGEFDVFLFYRIDRLARRLTLSLDLIGRFQEVNVATRSATEAFDTGTSQGRLIVGVLAGFAEFERDSLIERIIRGNAEKASRGHWVGGRPPFGYKVASDQKTLVVVPEQADIVRRIFPEYIEGREGTVEITKRLNEDGVLTPTRSKWKAQSVIDILRRPTYIGYIVHNDDAYEGNFEAIIDRPTFDKAQQLLDARSEMTTRKSSAPDYLLTGLVRCTECGGMYVGGAAHNANGERYRYYRCRKRALEAPAQCSAPNVRADLIEKAIVELVAQTYGKSELFKNAVTEAMKSSKTNRSALKRRIAVIDGELEKARLATARYAEAFEQGTLQPEMLAERLDQLTRQRFALERDRDDLRAELAQGELTVVSDELMLQVGSSVKDILAGPITGRKKDLLRVVIDHIDLAPDRTATPVLRVPAVPKAEQEGLSCERPSRSRTARRTIVRLEIDWVELEGIEPSSN